MPISLRRQDGYLTLIVAMIIVTVGFTSLMTSYTLSTRAQSDPHLAASLQAFYVAQAGLERAVFGLTQLGLGCTAINGTPNFTNATFTTLPGEFTVQGTFSHSFSAISSSIGAFDTIIPLGSSTQFASSGTIQIGTELINYMDMNGTPALTGVTRGANGTTAATHSANAPVYQNQCVLQSVGAAPSFGSPIATRSISVTLIAYGFGMGQSPTGAGSLSGSSLGAGSGVYQTAIITDAPLTLGGHSFPFTNDTVSASSPNFLRSSIWSTSTVSFSTPPLWASTSISNGSGGMVVSSSGAGLKGDIAASTKPLPFKPQFFQNFFSANKATIQASAKQCTDEACVIGASGLIWVPSTSTPLYFTGQRNIRLGSNLKPIILIVEGDMVVNLTSAIPGKTGTLEINGFLFVQGTLSGPVPDNGQLFVYGTMALGSAFSSGMTYNYRPSHSAGAAALTPYARVTYSKVPANTQEQFI